MSEQPTATRLVAASNNEHKLSEIRPLLAPDFRILSLADIGYHDELAETGDTLESNALQKASQVFDRFQMSCFADDTGLEVEAMQGAPGVYSARYAGPQRNSDDNIDLLLKNLAPHENRRARFRTVIALKTPKASMLFEGIVSGVILPERRGAGGFGYDPVFLPDNSPLSMAEMSMDQKNAISHRGRAVQRLVAWLKTNAENL